MTNEEKIKRINQWQDSGCVHPLTCSVNSDHDVLRPEVEQDNVILKCSTCGYVQKWIPECVLQSDPVRWSEVLE